MDSIVKYSTESGDEITLSLDIVRNTICDNPNITSQEFMALAALCKAHKLNPFIREAYIIKYGTQPATICAGKEAYTKRAFRNPRFQGYEAGIYVQTAMGNYKERTGSMVCPGEAVLGGWAKVHVDGYKVPIFNSVGFDEYAGRRKDGSLNKTWASKPGTMIRKVALVQALREAFPEDLGGMYIADEMGLDDREPDPIELGGAAVADSYQADGKACVVDDIRAEEPLYEYDIDF